MSRSAEIAGSFRSDRANVRIEPRNIGPEPLRGPGLRRALSLVTLAWIFGSVWGTAIGGAPFSLFARYLRASEFQIGLLGALPFMASLVNVPASILTERTGARKKIFLYGQYAQRLLWFPIALAPLWIVTHHGFNSGSALSLFLVLILLMHCCGAIGGPPWLSWMADVVPERVRGKYFSRRRQWGILSGIPAALAVGWLLDRVAPGNGHTDPLVILRWCAIIFMAAAVFGLADIHLFQYVPDVPMTPRPRVPMLKLLGQPLRDRQFMVFAGFVATLTFAVTFMGQFATFFLIDKVGVTGTGMQMMLLVAPGVAQLVAFPIWGRAVDRMGKKPVLAIASLGLVPVGLGWCFMGGGGTVAVALGYILSAAGAVLWAGVEVANLNFVLEFSGSGAGGDDAASGTSYVAVNSVIINIAGCMGGLASGYLAHLMRHWHWDPAILGLPAMSYYEVLFALSALLRLVAAVGILPYIKEHNAGTTRQALRFMTANLYEGMFNFILVPLRLANVRRGPIVLRHETRREIHKAA